MVKLVVKDLQKLQPVLNKLQPTKKISNQSIQLCNAELVRCYNFLFGTVRDNLYNFLNDKLFKLTPDHIFGYLAFKVFEISSLSESNEPAEGWSSTMEYINKVISYFMPNKLMKWDLQSNSGNPTKFMIVNELMKRVKKHEVRREEKASSVRHAKELPNFLEPDNN